MDDCFLGVARHLVKRGVLEASTTTGSDAGGMGPGAGGSYAGRPSQRTAYRLQVLPCLIVIPSPEQQQQHLPSVEVWHLSKRPLP
jgi:hypothetical protein